MAEDTLVFFDKDFWVCSCALSQADIDNPTFKIRRHYSLPRDWLNTECLRLAIITKEGSLVCPKNGEVAVIRDGLKEEQIES